MVFASRWALNKGYYGRFKVDTRLTEKKDWVMCKGPYSLNESHFPHIVQCNASITLAKYIRLSVGGNKPLYLYEVKVAGTVKGESEICFKNVLKMPCNNPIQNMYMMFCKSLLGV